MALALCLRKAWSPLITNIILTDSCLAFFFLCGVWLLSALFWLLVLDQFSRKHEAGGCCVCAVWGAGGLPLCWGEDAPLGLH